MFKFLVVFLTIFEVSPKTGVVAEPASSTYTTKYDNIDWDAIANSPRLLRMYLNCLLDNGPCNPEGREFKKNMPDAIQNECAKCTKAQKKGAGRILKYLKEEKPEWYKEVKDKLDPGGKAEEVVKKLIEESEKP